jgi:hypothetical protein
MPPSFVSCWTELHAPSIRLSTPTSMAPGNRPPVGSHNIYGLTESRYSGWSCLRGMIPTAFSFTASEPYDKGQPTTAPCRQACRPFRFRGPGSSPPWRSSRGILYPGIATGPSVRAFLVLAAGCEDRPASPLRRAGTRFVANSRWSYRRPRPAMACEHTDSGDLELLPLPLAGASAALVARVLSHRLPHRSAHA